MRLTEEQIRRMIAASEVYEYHDGAILELIREVEAAVLQSAGAGEPVAWRAHVEQRLLTWRQRFVNRSGDQLALDDFMDKRSLDDLVDFVCDEYAHPAPAGDAAQGDAGALADEFRKDQWWYAELEKIWAAPLDRVMTVTPDMKRAVAVVRNLLDRLSAIAQQPAKEAPAGWKLVIAKGIDELFQALERADRKGYLPDALADEWAAFDYQNTSPAAAPANQWCPRGCSPGVCKGALRSEACERSAAPATPVGDGGEAE